MRDKDRFVDELLDSALAHHRAAEPRPGLESRLLERVRAAAVKRDSGTQAWKLWIAAAATAVVILLFFGIRVANRAHSPAIETSEAVNTVPSTSSRQILTANSGITPKAGNAIPIIEPKRAAHQESKRSRQVEAHHWPSQFPTPAPLTPEQKALVQYVRDTPPKVLAASLSPHLSAPQPTELKPVQFSSIQIQPLTVIKPGEELQ